MNKLFFCLILVFLTNSFNGLAQRPSFFIWCTEAEGENAPNFAKDFEDIVAYKIVEGFPCARVNSQSKIRARLRYLERYEREGGVSNYDNFLLDHISSNYLITLMIVEGYDNSVSLTFKCVQNSSKNTIAQGTLQITTAKDNYGFQESFRLLAKDILKQLGTYEICPFKGEIDIDITSERNDNQSESYNVYCNGQDGVYKLDTKINNLSEINWKLYKTKRFQTTGYVTINLFEETISEEQNDCYRCKSGREGPRVYTQRRIKSARIEGLSEESICDNQKIQDVRTELTFYENGTYILTVKAASKNGDLTYKTEIKAEGTCDNQSFPPEIIRKKANIPLNEVFGPYKGTATDDLLAESNTIIKVDPLTNEKKTFTFSFFLKKD